MKRSTLAFLFAIVLALAAVERSPACPMCKDSISDTAESGDVQGGGMESSLPGGFNTSVYLMLAAFLGTSGLIVGVITKGILGANAQKRDQR